MIFNIRGTNGSGKTYIVYRLMEEFQTNPIMSDNPKKAEGYWLPALNLYIAGRYTTNCGGADTIKTQDEVQGLVLRYHQKGHVLFEGVLVSTLWSRWWKLSQALSQGQFIWCFLDTPPEACLERIIQRTGKAPKNGDIGIRSKHKQIGNVRAKALVENEEVHILRWEAAYEDFKGLLQKKGVLH